MLSAAAVVLGLAMTGPSNIWGTLGFGIYPTDAQKVAPNGLVYDPLFRFTADLNVRATEHLKFFFDFAFWAEAPSPGVTTNGNQGQFDFTRRQIDFTAGIGYSFSRGYELRLWNYCQCNMNRGIDLNRPSGFKDGTAGSLRYYLDKEWSFDPDYLEGGYYFTKELADTRGNPYTPGLFAGGKYTLPVKGHVYFSTEANLLTERPAKPKELYVKAGLLYRLGQVPQKSELGVFYERDIGLLGLPGRGRVLLEIKRYFSSD